MGMGYKITSEPFFIGASVTMTAADAYTQATISAPLDSLNREGLLIHAVYFTASQPERIVNANSSVTIQLTSTSKTALVQANDANLIAKRESIVLGGAAEFSGPHIEDFIGQEGPFEKMDNLGIVATDDLFLSMDSVNQVSAKSGQVRVVCSRIRMDADTYAALVTNELSS